MPKLFGLDSGTVREILKLHALDGATPRRVKKLFGLDNGTVRLIFEDFSSFVAAGQANLIQSPVNEVVDFGVRSDFNAGGADVSVNATGSGDTSNVGGISGLSIDVDSNHTYSSTVAADPSDSNGASASFISGNSVSASTALGFIGYTADGASGKAATRATSEIFGGSYPGSNGDNSWGSNVSNAFIIGTLNVNLAYVNNLVNPGFRTVSENGGSSTYTTSVLGTSYTIRCCNSRTSSSAQYDGFGVSYGAYWTLSLGDVGSNQLGFFYRATRFNPNFPENPSQSGTQSGAGGSSYILYYPGYTTTSTVTGRRARVQNGSNRTFNITGGGLTAGGNFSTGNLAAGASTSFITANSTNESWSLTGTGTKNPATFSITNNDGDISVSGTFADDANATTARDAIQAALNANSTFVSKFNTGTDIDKTVSSVAHKVVRFTSDSAENTSDFSMTITQNDGSNTTPHEETVTQGAVESLQTQVQVTRDVEGTEVSSTKSISSQANTDTAGAEVATLGGDISYDSSTNKLKVQDRDATVTVTNAGTLSFTKE